MDDVAVRCKHLVKTYPGRPPVEAVRGLVLEVFNGECFGSVGSSHYDLFTTRRSVRHRRMQHALDT